MLSKSISKIILIMFIVLTSLSPIGAFYVYTNITNNSSSTINILSNQSHLVNDTIDIIELYNKTAYMQTEILTSNVYDINLNQAWLANHLDDYDNTTILNHNYRFMISNLSEFQNSNMQFNNYKLNINTLKKYIEVVDKINEDINKSLRTTLLLFYIIYTAIILVSLGVVFILNRYSKEALELKLKLTTNELEQIKLALDEHAIISMTNTDGVITYSNKKFSEISGYSEDELIGNTHSILKSGFHGDEFYKNMWDTIKSGEIWHGEVKNKKKLGGFYWVKATIMPFTNILGEQDKYIAIRTDITQRKEAEKSLSTSRDQILEAWRSAIKENKQKTYFMANISHELKTPLNSISGHAQLLSNEIYGPLNSKYKDFALTIEKSSFHLLSLIEDILDTSKSLYSNLQLNPTYIESEKLVEDIIPIYNAQFDNRIKSSVINTKFYADEKRIRQILINLLTNALKFSGDKEIKIKSYQQEDNIVFKIIDAGIGMNKEEQVQCVQPFTQIGRGNVFGHEGTGLGMTLAKQLTEEHFGDFNIKSKPNLGTVITVTLPLDNKNIGKEKKLINII